jgi:hypothetical protein
VAIVSCLSSMIAVAISAVAFKGPPADAITFRQMTLARNVVKAGEDLQLSFTYDKRAACFGTGAYGEYYFRVWDGDGNASSLRKLPDGRVADDPAGLGQRANLIVTLAHILPPLEPGRYALQVVAAFRCKGENQQFVLSPKVPFVVSS